MAEAHVRIDEGIPKGKRTKIKPSDLERQARDEAGRFLTKYSPELRDRTINDALIALECGARVETVAQKHDVPISTLYSWLIGDERAARYRTAFFDGRVAQNLAEIRVAESPLELARAREELAGWVKVAERRDPKSYAQKQEVTVELVGDMGDRLRRARERVIEAEKAVVAEQLTQVQHGNNEIVVEAAPNENK